MYKYRCVIEKAKVILTAVNVDDQWWFLHTLAWKLKCPKSPARFKSCNNVVAFRLDTTQWFSSQRIKFYKFNTAHESVKVQ